MMILVVLNKNPKDCVTSKSCVDQEVALDIGQDWTNDDKNWKKNCQEPESTNPRSANNNNRTKQQQQKQQQQQ